MRTRHDDGPRVRAGPAPPAAAAGTESEATSTAVDVLQQAQHRLSRAQVLAVMTRAGYTPDEVLAAAAALPEQVDRYEDRVVLARFALTRGQLMDRMGSSP
ncbi:MAG: hypothetical protein JWN17_1763 [Frankiales bacterium]|nr:hypothetical protein [Frankiales bacterium]